MPMENKTPEMKAFIESVFPGTLALIAAKKCPLCEHDIDTNGFSNNLSLKEYYISGMCQECQDKTFGYGED